MPTLEDIHGVIDKWFGEKLRSPPLSQFTPAYNQVSAAAADLKAQVASLFTPPVAATPPAAKPAPKPPAAEEPAAHEEE